MFPVAILAGGLATRLRPTTEKIPKSLLIVAGRPFIFHQLELLREQGVERVVLCVGYLGQQLRAAVGDGCKFGISVDYSFDGERLLGTGGALKRALPLLAGDFFVMYGDSYLPCNFADVMAAYKVSRRPALMTVLRNENRWDKSNVLFRDGTLLEYNKQAPSREMEYIDYGLGVVSACVFDDYADNESFDLAEVYQHLSRCGLLEGHEVHERFYEIGSRQGIQETGFFLLKRMGKE